MATVKALAHVKEHIVTEIIFTPKDFESHYHAKFGADLWFNANACSK